MNFLEIQFGISGAAKTLPADHGYALYSAVKRVLQREDFDPKDIPVDIKLCSVSGIPNRDGKIYLHRQSRVRVRCLPDKVQIWYRLLQNQELNIRGHKVRLVRPRLALPEASEVVRARMVTFKLERVDHPELPHYFLDSCHRGLAQLEITGGSVFIPSDRNGNLARKTLQIKDKKIIGYALTVEGLNAEDSLKLQWHGLGGRQHFGCGWFYPYKGEGHGI